MSVQHCPVCGMKAPVRDGVCVLCDVLGKSPPKPRGSRGGKR